MPFFTCAEGLNLHYTDTGTGLPLLCLPGLTRSGADFRYVAPHLTGVRLLTLDMRGRGASDRDPEWQNYSLPVECQDILAFLDHLKLDKVAILGTSRGGLQAMALATTHRARLLAVALNDIGPVLEGAGLAVIMTYLGQRPNARNHAEGAKALARASVGFENVPDSRWLEEAQTHFIETPDGLDLAYDPRLRDAVASAGTVPDLWPMFDALAGLPLCLLRGSGSNLLSAATAQRMQARRPDMISAEIPGRGHVPFLDEPEALAALHQWLETLA